jgi:hypothetical protein
MALNIQMKYPGIFEGLESGDMQGFVNRLTANGIAANTRKQMLDMPKSPEAMKYEAEKMQHKENAKALRVLKV